MLRAALVALPVHSCRAAVEHLHAVRADVPHAGFWIFRENQRERDVSAAIVRPAFQDRQTIQRAIAVDDFMTRRVLHRPRHQVAQPSDHRQHLQRVQDAFGHLRRHELVDLLGQIVECLHAEREAHTLVRSVQVRSDRNIVAGWSFEQQCRTTAGDLARAIGDGRDLEVGAHRLHDAREEAAFVEIGDEVVEIAVHREPDVVSLHLIGNGLRQREGAAPLLAGDDRRACRHDRIDEIGELAFERLLVHDVDFPALN